MDQIHEQSNLIMSETTSRIIGCAIKMHRALGPGYDEAFYHKALASELTAAGIGVKCEVEFPVYYGETLLGTKRVDLVVGECLVELKAKKGLENIDAAQVVSYLKASGYPLALLINFGCTRVQTKRFVNSAGSISIPSAPHTTPHLRDCSEGEQPTCQE